MMHGQKNIKLCKYLFVATFNCCSHFHNFINNNILPTFTMTSEKCDTTQWGDRCWCFSLPMLPSLYAAVLFHKHTQTARTKHLTLYSFSLTTPQPQPSLSIPSLISNRVNKTTAANRSAKQRTPHIPAATHTHSTSLQSRLAGTDQTRETRISSFTMKTTRHEASTL